MGFGQWWRWPALILQALAALTLLLTLAQAWRSHRHWRARRRLRAGLRGVLALLGLALTLLLGGAGLSLRDYRLLTAETPVATLQATRLAPQRWQVRLRLADGRVRRAQLDGDDFRIEAQVVKWTPAALIFGDAPPLYRLDRLSGRYEDIGQARQAPHTVVALGTRHAFDLWRLKRQFPRWLPGVDAVFGSGAYLPLVDGGRYRIRLMRSGALVVRPADATTAARLRALGVQGP